MSSDDFGLAAQVINGFIGLGINLVSELEKIGKYEIVGTLGRGSQGVVYRGRDPEIGRTVAIKTLRKLSSLQTSGTDQSLERFRNEARSAGNLRHPNIITIFEVNIEDDMPYIVMDYVEGEGLDAAIARHGKLEPVTTIAYLSQVAAALDYAHSKGVIHRDIKPSNLLIDKGGVVYILDFGIAKIQESYSGESKATGQQSIMGSPGYMSPEQILNEELDYRSDLFSLAVVAFECFTGQRPFLGSHFAAVVGNIVSGKPQSLTALDSSLPLWLESELERGLSRNKDDRFVSAVEMVRALAKAVNIQMASLGNRAPESTNSGRIKKLSSWQSIPAEQLPARSQATVSTKPTANNSQTQYTQAGSTGSYGIGSQLERPSDLFSQRYSAYEKQIEATGRKPSLMSLLTITLAVLSLFVGAVVLYVALFKDNTPVELASENQTVETAEPTALSQSESQMEDELNPASVETAPIPVGKLASEMSDREILSVLLSDQASETLIVDALHEGLHRRVPKLAEAAIKQLTNDSYVVRVEALKMYAALADRRAVPQILSSVDDHDPVVRVQAAKTLATLGTRQVVGFLNSKRATESAPEVREALKIAIEKILGHPL